MFRLILGFWTVVFLIPIVTSCGGTLPFADRETKAPLENKKNSDHQDPQMRADAPDDKDEDGLEEEHDKNSDRGSDVTYTLKDVFEATQKATDAYPRGVDDPHACLKIPAIVRDHQDLVDVTSWKPSDYDVWVRIDYVNQCNDKPAKVYFWCHFHTSAHGAKHIACHARGSATIDWERLQEPFCGKSDNDCGGSESEEKGGGGLPLP